MYELLRPSVCVRTGLVTLSEVESRANVCEWSVRVNGMTA